MTNDQPIAHTEEAPLIDPSDTGAGWRIVYDHDTREVRSQEEIDNRVRQQERRRQRRGREDDGDSPAAAV